MLFYFGTPYFILDNIQQELANYLQMTSPIVLTTVSCFHLSFYWVTGNRFLHPIFPYFLVSALFFQFLTVLEIVCCLFW